MKKLAVRMYEKLHREGYDPMEKVDKMDNNELLQRISDQLDDMFKEVNGRIEDLRGTK